MNPFSSNLFDEQYDVENITPDALKPWPNCRGVILFADADGTPVQLLGTAHLRQAAQSRLFPESDETPSRKVRLDAVIGRAGIVCCYNEFKTLQTQRGLAEILFDDPDEHVKLPRPSFVGIDLSSRWPRFRVHESPRRDEITFAPFPTSRSVQAFAEALCEIFDLCRRPGLIDDPEKAAACPYLQMEKCPAPCVGRISRETYLEALGRAAEFFPHGLGELAERFTEEMNQAAKATDFEKAQTFKKKLRAVRTLEGPDYAWTQRLERFDLLHVDKWDRVALQGSRKKVQRYRAYRIRAGGIEESEAFGLPVSEETRSRLEDFLKERPGAADAAETVRTLSLMSSFIYRKNPPGRWFRLNPPAGIRVEELEAALSEPGKEDQEIGS